MALTQVQGGMLAGSTNTTTTIQSNGTTAITIDTSQNVGVGTASPATRLDVRCVSDVTQDIAYFSRPDAAVRAKIALDGSGIINFGTSTNHPLAFLTNNTERMRITSSGQLFVNNTTNLTSGALDNVQIGCTAPSSSIQYGMMIGGNATGFTVNAIRFVNTYTPAVVGTITIGSSSTAYNTSSDYRLKENVAPMTGALAKVAQLKPVTYTWKATGETSQGFIAHELQEVVPDCVTGEKDAVDEEGNPQYQGIDTSFLVATLTAAIQELKAELDATKAEVAALKAAP